MTTISGEWLRTWDRRLGLATEARRNHLLHDDEIDLGGPDGWVATAVWVDLDPDSTSTQLLLPKYVLKLIQIPVETEEGTH